MGQKVNPHGIRVGVIKDWDSKWYAEADFADNLVEDYNISGNIFHGMTGYVDYRFPKDPEQSRLLKTVFAYATYCGVGGKTGMGMGGFVLA